MNYFLDRHYSKCERAEKTNKSTWIEINRKYIMWVTEKKTDERKIHRASETYLQYKVRFTNIEVLGGTEVAVAAGKKMKDNGTQSPKFDFENDTNDQSDPHWYIE